MVNHTKEELFNIAMRKNLFWSYSKDMKLRDITDNLLIEVILKYGDINELNALFKIYDYDKIYKVWLKSMIFDNRFEKLNFYLSKIYFDKDVEKIKKDNVHENRYEKLRLLTSKNQTNS